MNCNYCKEKCTELLDVYYDGGGFAYHQFDCINCPVKVKYCVDDSNIIINTDFFLEEGEDRRYRIFCSHSANACLIQYQLKINWNWKVTEVDLDFIPDWDPKTIIEKLKLYINFL
jgi:hypothetical protein